MYVLDVEADDFRRMTFEVKTSEAVGQMIKLLYTLAVGVKKVTVTFRDEMKIAEDVVVE